MLEGPPSMGSEARKFGGSRTDSVMCLSDGPPCSVSGWPLYLMWEGSVFYDAFIFFKGCIDALIQSFGPLRVEAGILILEGIHH